MESFVRPLKSPSRWRKALSVGMAAVSLLIGGRAPAQTYGTFYAGASDPSQPGNYGTMLNYTNFIYATNFFVGPNSTFSFTLVPSSANWWDALYQQWRGTLNFTNIGEMDASTGFRFDTKSQAFPYDREAGSFYNAANINCDVSSLIFLNEFSIGRLLLGGYGGISVWATNIFNSGTIAVGADGLAIFTGDNVNFSRGAVVVTQPNILLGSGSYHVTATGQAAASTNAWSPAGALGPLDAYGVMNSTPYELFLINSAPYFNVQTDSSGSNVVVRMIFLQDNSVNVATNVYFSNALGNGWANVEWVGSHIDPATGQAVTNYLYLEDDYVQGSGTNMLSYPGTGVPANYTFYASSSPLVLGTPATNGFVTGLLPSDSITNNIYSYVNAQFVATSVSTSNAITGPIALTNLPGNVQISAAKSLSFSLASLTGMNYLQLNSPNEFDTDGRSQFAAPYSDLYLGHTNGTMIISNLVQSAIPQWSGTVQAWNTRFTNSVNGINYDFRVLLVASQLNPLSAAQQQDFVLNSSNNVVISDQLNISRTFSLNCTNLLITTNGVGNGAASLEGELNLNSSTIDWLASAPRLLVLTNNGAIRLMDTARFFSQSNALSIIPGTNAIAATGTLSEVHPNLNVSANEAVRVGTSDYTFVTALANTTPNQVKIGAVFDGTMSNLIAAINHAAGAGSSYSTNTTANLQVTAGALLNHGFTVTAIIPGAAGNTNAVNLTYWTTNLTWNGQTTLAGGADAVAPVTNGTPVYVPYHSMVNSGAISGQGVNIWSDDFENYGTFSADSAGTNLYAFAIQSLTTTMSNGVVSCGGTFSITASNLVVAGTTIQAGKSLTLTVTNLTDYGNTSNFWTLGTTYSGYGTWNGLELPSKPQSGDLHGTTITMIAVTNTVAPGGTLLASTWSAEDRGATVAGFSNNAAIGQLILDSQGAAPNTGFYFQGTGVSNAMYVDNLVLMDQATNLDGSYNLTALQDNPNFHIYYAQAMLNGVSVAEKLNHKNNDLLRWVPTYAGLFSSTNLVYPPGVTNVVNAALAGSSDIDSDGDGNPNSTDPTPFLVPAQVNFTETLTNQSVRLQWFTVASAANEVDYKTNLLSPDWLVLTNFASPWPYPSPPGYVWVLDSLTNAPRFYRVMVQPNLLQGMPNP